MTTDHFFKLCDVVIAAAAVIFTIVWKTWPKKGGKK